MIKLVVISILTSLSAIASEPQIVIRKESFVEGPTIQLSEVATFENIAEEKQRQLGTITLANSPEFGEVRNFSSAALSEILRSKLKDNKLKISIPGSILVKSASSRIDQANIKNRIIAGVQSFCVGCRVEVRDLRLPKMESAGLQSSWDLTPDWSRIRGSFQIPLEVVTAEGKKTIHWITGRAVLKQPVVVLKRGLIFGERVQESDLGIQDREVTYAPDVIVDIKEAVGSQMKMPLTANSLLTRAHLQRPPALVRGQDVTVRMAETGWNVSIKGIAEQNGFVGDLVRVLNPNTKKVIVGTVIADGIVEVR